MKRNKLWYIWYRVNGVNGTDWKYHQCSFQDESPDDYELGYVLQEKENLELNYNFKIIESKDPEDIGAYNKWFKFGCLEVKRVEFNQLAELSKKYDERIKDSDETFHEYFLKYLNNSVNLS